MLQCGSQGRMRPGPPAGGAQVQHPVQLLQPEIRLRQREPPGVTSAVLKPKQAIAYLEQVLEAEPRITVAGIAGPGDPFANPKETLETIRLIRRRFPDLLLCLATNGLGLPPYLDELAELQVSHVTLTVNAVDPEIGGQDL